MLLILKKYSPTAKKSMAIFFYRRTAGIFKVFFPLNDRPNLMASTKICQDKVYSTMALIIKMGNQLKWKKTDPCFLNPVNISADNQRNSV